MIFLHEKFTICGKKLSNSPKNSVCEKFLPKYLARMRFKVYDIKKYENVENITWHFTKNMVK